MAYKQPFLRLVASGSLYTGEQFSWGLSLIADFPTDNAGFSAVPAGVRDAVASFHQQTSQAAARLTTVKLNLIGTNGKYASSTDTTVYDYPTPVAGGGSGVVPAQIALAVSLVTGAKRGLASKGRFYIPVPIGTLGTDGLLPAATSASVASQAATLINAIHAGVGGDWRVGVVSDVGAGAQREVTSLRVGRVLDTIRSRRTSLPESYQVNATAITP